MNKLTKSHRNSIRVIYDRQTLSRILHLSNTLPATDDGNVEFASFQRDVLQSAFEGLHYDSSTINFMEISKDQAADSSDTVCLRVSREIIEAYNNITFTDPMIPLVFTNPGRMLTTSMIMPRKDNKTHPYYTEFLNKFGILDGAIVAYLRPAHHNSFILFTYTVTKDADAWYRFDHTRLELASFPFYLAWLNRKGFIDQVELKKRFLILEDLTEHQLQNLRKFVNSPQQDFNEQARDLGIKPGTLKDDLYNTRNIILSRVHAVNKTKPPIGKRALRELEHHCGFIKELGDHTQPIIKPDPSN